MTTPLIKVQAAGIRELTTGRCHSQPVGLLPYSYAPTIVKITTQQLGPQKLINPFKETQNAAAVAIQPFIHRHVQNSYFWDGRYDPVCTGRMELPNMTCTEYEEFLNLKGQYAYLDQANVPQTRCLPGEPFHFAALLSGFMPNFLPPEPRKPHNIQVTDTEWQLARQVGGGNASAGIRHLLSIYENLLESQ